MSQIFADISRISAPKNFEDAIQEALQFLQNHIGLRLWMLTRVDNDDWLVLSSQDKGYGVRAGDVFRWSDSFCSRMVQGLGPQITPCSLNVTAYATAPIAQQIPIQAYIGIPLYLSDGSLFGTLCAIDPDIQSSDLATHLPLVECVASLLAALLCKELQALEYQRQRNKLELESQQDILTQVYNRRGWDQLVASEEEGCRKFGTTASMILIDLDNFKEINDSHGHAAGDQVLQRAAQMLQTSLRECDVLARLGGDEFAILLVDCTPSETEQVVNRIRSNLANVGIQASIGWAVRRSNQTLVETLHRADSHMYANKTIRKQQEKFQPRECTLSQVPYSS